MTKLKTLDYMSSKKRMLIREIVSGEKSKYYNFIHLKKSPTYKWVFILDKKYDYLR